MKSKKLAALACLFSLAMTPAAWADVDQVAALSKMVQEMGREMNQMKKTIERQDDKIRQLEIKGHLESPSGTQAVSEPSVMTDKDFEDRLSTALGGSNKWLKDLKFGGDLRLRYEGFDFTSGNPSETDPRNRFRFRLRYGFEKKFSDEMKIGFAMASGEQTNGTNVDPLSTNSTFDNVFNFKNIFIEKAYATYMPNWAKIGPVEKLEITGGKANNPFELGSSELIWDRDVKPEGIYEKVDIKVIESDNLDLKAYITGGQYILDEDSSLASAGDAQLFAVQGGLNPVFYVPFLERPVDMLQAVSYYNYADFANGSNFIIGTTSLANGNPNTSGPTTQLDTRNFQVIESYSELALYPYGFPTRLFLDVAGNPASSPIASQGPTILHSNFAWAIGTRLGQLKQKGDWEARYEYRYIGANAVVGAFSDSDFGLGGVGKQGSVVKLAYMITDSLALAGSMNFTDNLNAGTAGVMDQQTRRFQLDLVWKF
ncbi:MAG: putative porin [Candidatus Omnitrophica bacterium]|nr:putative porin [Candidatus Omnitrophota bacterium]